MSWLKQPSTCSKTKQRSQSTLGMWHTSLRCRSYTWRDGRSKCRAKQRKRLLTRLPRSWMMMSKLWIKLPSLIKLTKMALHQILIKSSLESPILSSLRKSRSVTKTMRWLRWGQEPQTLKTYVQSLIFKHSKKPMHKIPLAHLKQSKKQTVPAKHQRIVHQWNYQRM